MASLGNNLPDIVMIEILSRLPPESLLRFRCVAKSWYDLFNELDFSSSLKNQSVLLKRILKINDSNMYETKFSFSDYPFQPPINDLNIQYFVDQRSMSYLNGHSHGLLCFSIFPSDIFLCNPFTGNVRRLPPSTLPIYAQQQSDPFGVDSYPAAIGFGYDSKSRDFKVVRVVNYVEPPFHLLPPRVEVYHLGKDRWTEIKTPIHGLSHQDYFHMYFQGFYYWWADHYTVGQDKLCPKEGWPKILWRFNMSEEVFDHISVPNSRRENGGWYSGMGVLNGSIVLFYCTEPHPRDERRFEVWRMEVEESSSGGGGVTALWSKVFTIGPILGALTPLEFVDSDEVLMEDKEEGQLLLYNTKTQHCKHLPLQGLPETFEATIFVKTLLSVNGGGHK